MHNKFVKGIASVLGAALVLGSVVVSAVPANAATSKKGSDGYETTYTAQELKLDADAIMGDCTVTNAADGAVTITLPSQWNQVFFEIPAEIIAAKWKSVIPQTGDGDTGFAIKLNDKKATGDNPIRGVVWDPNGQQINRDASYIDAYGGEPTATEADFDGVIYFDIMNGSESSNTVTLKSVTFVTEKEVTGISSDTNTNDGGFDINTPVVVLPGNDNSPKTDDSMNGVLIVSVLGGLLLISAAGLLLTRQRKSR